ncbi:MAG: GNAT family N-acetyltransferase [Caulobacter sp.]|nr:GNAT family N-acetyltransferase [Caulobacter sp.]
MTPISIRPCTDQDARRLSAVATATFLETYAGIVDGEDILHHCATTHAAETYQRLLADPERQLFLATMAPGEAPVGFLLLSPPDLPVALKPGDRELTRIYLLHRMHGQGLGARLMTAAVEAARAGGAGRLLLGVYGGNDKALAFYGRMGFRQVGVRVFRVGATDYNDQVLALDL